LLVPVSEPEKLMAAIDRLLNDSELGLRLTRQAAQLIATKHKPEQYVRSLTQIYADVVNARLI
jgi:glycosyltransferase involved in cell wall biosynthesis